MENVIECQFMFGMFGVPNKNTVKYVLVEERLLDGLNFLRQMIDPPPEVSHFNSP